MDQNILILESNNININDTPLIDEIPNDLLTESEQQYNEIKLVNQGTYGCVYKPEITCDGEIGDIHYISKIQLNEGTIQNEQMIGSLLQEKISLLSQYFAPIIKTCPVSLGPISKSEQEKCDVIKKNTTGTSKYISSKIRYIGTKNIGEYLESLPLYADVLIKKIQFTYYYLLNSIHKLNSLDIIHYDIKEGNILCDENNNLPIIIDFGISFFSSQVTIENRSRVFYIYEFYPYWCIDIYILSYIAQKKNRTNTVTIDELYQIFHSFFEKFKKYTESHNILITEDEENTFKTKYDNYFKQFTDAVYTWESVYNKLYVPKNYKTWDNYSIAITYLTIIQSLSYIPLEPGSLIPLSNKEPFNKLPIIQKYIALLKKIIFSMPEERLDTETTMKEFITIR